MEGVEGDGKRNGAQPIGIDAMSTSIVKQQVPYHPGQDDSAHAGPYGPPVKEGLEVDVESVEYDEHGRVRLDKRKNVTLAAGFWYHAAWHIATTICTPAAYAPLALAFAWLGWPAGVICLFTATLVSCYNSWLLTDLHEEPGTGRRRVRYAQIAEEVWGTGGYWAVSFFQQVASIGNNIACEIGAALAMQAIWNLYYPDGAGMTTQKMIIIFASFQLVLSQLPDIHHLTFFNAFSTFCTIGFTICTLALNIWTGYRWRSLCNDDPVANAAYCPNFDYGGDVYSSNDLVYGVFSALGIVAFGFGDTILPEIQATIRNPHVLNTRRGLLVAYAIIACNYFIVAVSGYWAFGFTASTAPWLPVIYAPPAVTAAQNWAVVLVNLFAIIQIAGCFQIYCRPTYEWADIKLQDLTKGPWAPRNVIARFGVTLTYSCLMTLICCAIPFFGDFVALVGAVGFIPLDFILPMLMYNKAKNPHISVKIVHLFIATIFIGIGVVGFIGACKWINDHIHMYQVFGNVGAPLPAAGDYSSAGNTTMLLL